MVLNAVEPIDSCTVSYLQVKLPGITQSKPIKTRLKPVHQNKALNSFLFIIFCHFDKPDETYLDATNW